MLPRPCSNCGRPGKALCDQCSAVLQARREPNPYRQGAYQTNRAAIVREVLRNPLTICVICGKGFSGCETKDITAEHIKPLRHGGTHDTENLAPAHSWCNYGWRKRRSNDGNC